MRSLEREISKICRKVVKQLLLKKPGQEDPRQREEPRQVPRRAALQLRRGRKENQVGQVTGLAWTEVGGDLLTIEVATMPGKGNVHRTGSLGDVMKESVEAATIGRARACAPARSPRRGVSRKPTCTCTFRRAQRRRTDRPPALRSRRRIVSALSGIPVRADVAMTGEITLRGEVLAIGGLKEKLLAAHRGGIKTVLIPEENVKDLAEIPDNVKNRLEIVPVKWIDKVLEVALERQPVPLTDEEAAATAGQAGRSAGTAGEVVKH